MKTINTYYMLTMKLPMPSMSGMFYVLYMD